MKFSTTVVPLLCATTVSSRSLFLASSSSVSINEEFKVPGENPLTFCQDPAAYPAEITSVDLDPNPPKAGTKLIIKASGYAHKEIVKGAKVQLRVRFNNIITLINQTADFCDNLGKIDMECPVEKGPITIEREADLPSAIPPGRYDAYANVIDEDGNVLTCMEATVHFSRG